jgi:protein gp37
MADGTAIEWTDATWNPVRGCTRVSPGCGGPGPHGGCYAERVAARFSGPGQAYEGLAKMRNKKARWTGKVAFVDGVLTQPLRWTRPRRIFVNSMSDLFHESVLDEWIDRIFAVMALAPQHTFQVLTKRADRMRDYFTSCPISMRARAIKREAHEITGGDTHVALPLSNVWLGVSAEDQQRAGERVPDLLQTPAAVRFVSAEPLLGPIDFTDVFPDLTATLNAFTGEGRHLLGMSAKTLGPLDWIIVGGESGPRSRPMHPAWVSAIRDQCAAAGVAFFFKQWGEWVAEVQSPEDIVLPASSRCPWPRDETAVYQVGKRRAGRFLNGRTHDEMPA